MILDCQRLTLNGSFLLEQFQQADRDKNGVISFEETLAMLRRLNISFDENETLALFNVSIILMSFKFNGDEY